MIFWCCECVVSEGVCVCKCECVSCVSVCMWVLVWVIEECAVCGFAV